MASPRQHVVFVRLPCIPNRTFIVRQLIRELVLYCGASGLGLVVDVGLLWLLVEHAHLYYLSAAGISFLGGTAVVYALSVSAIFAHRRVSDRRLEFSVFAAIGLLGFARQLGGAEGRRRRIRDALPSWQVCVRLFTFSLNFGLRRMLLFTAPNVRSAQLTTRESAR